MRSVEIPASTDAGTVVWTADCVTEGIEGCTRELRDASAVGGYALLLEICPTDCTLVSASRGWVFAQVELDVGRVRDVVTPESVVPKLAKSDSKFGIGMANVACRKAVDKILLEPVEIASAREDDDRVVGIGGSTEVTIASLPVEWEAGVLRLRYD